LLEQRVGKNGGEKRDEGDNQKQQTNQIQKNIFQFEE